LQQAVKESKVKTFALTSAPYIAEDRGCKMEESARLDRLRLTVRQLKPAATLHVITYLGGLHDEKAVPKLDDRSFALWNEVIKPHAKDGRFVFVVGASLEDHYRDTGPKEDDAALQAILKGLERQKGEKDNGAADERKKTLDKLIEQKRFWLVRSPDPAKMPASPGSKTQSWNGKQIEVIHEAHGVAPTRNYEIWSNDGPFVSAGSDETCDPGCTNLGASQTLEKFLQPSVAKYRILWRPAYNLWNLNGNNYKNPEKKTVEGKAPPHFNDHEKGVLKKFLSPDPDRKPR
jgi:hypothetical protein